MEVSDYLERIKVLPEHSNSLQSNQYNMCTCNCNIQWHEYILWNHLNQAVKKHNIKQFWQMSKPHYIMIFLISLIFLLNICLYFLSVWFLVTTTSKSFCKLIPLITQSAHRAAFGGILHEAKEHTNPWPVDTVRPSLKASFNNKSFRVSLDTCTSTV